MNKFLWDGVYLLLSSVNYLIKSNSVDPYASKKYPFILY